MATRPPTIIADTFCVCLMGLLMHIPPVAASIPEDILSTVLRNMGDKWKHLDPIKMSTPLFHAKVISHDEHYQLNNRSIPPGERINNLVVGLTRAGDQRKSMVTFHQCLLQTGYNNLAREAQQRGTTAVT